MRQLNLQQVGAASRFGELVNLFSLEVPLSQFQDSFPQQNGPEPRPYIEEEDRQQIGIVAGGAAEVMGRLPDQADQWMRDEAAYPFLLGLLPFAEKYFPGQVQH